MKNDDRDFTTSQSSTKNSSKTQRTISVNESRIIIDQIIESAKKIIRIFDYDLSDPGYSDPTRIRLLESHLLRSRQNQLQIVVHESHHINRDCARLITLLRYHSDTFTLHRTIDAARQAADPLVMADENSYWHKLHQQQSTAVFAFDDKASAAPLLHRFEEIWESSEIAIGANVLGL